MGDIVVVRVESGMYFANADHVREQIRDRIGRATVAVVLDAATTPSIDVTAADMLVALGSELRHRGIELLIAHSVSQLRDVLLSAGHDDLFRSVYPTVDAAIAAVDRTQQPGADNN